MSTQGSVTAHEGEGPSAWAIVVHGGAGDVPAPRLAAHVAGCERAAEEGASVLAAGGTALDAVERAVAVLEDDPLFNAGTGACLDEDGRLFLEASIMEGKDLRAGAVATMPPFQHPIAIARAVMEDGRHVILASEGAARFAREHGFSPADEAAMITDHARARLAEARGATRRADPAGTVGAVARDARGSVAAATSTGGRVGKLAGRVGDTPVIGAGTYADDASGACSTTGHGEAMLRVCLAKIVTLSMEAGQHPEAAACAGLEKMTARTSLTGGLVAVSQDGSYGVARTTPTMTWAAVTPKGRRSGH